MGIEITSTTDSKEQVRAATTDVKAKEDPKVEKKSAPVQVKPATDETAEDSDASEELEDGDESETQEDTDEDESKDAEKPKKKKKGGFEKRIEKLNKKLSARDAEIEHWKKEALARAAEKPAETKPQAAPAKPVQSDEGKPKPEKYESHAEYVEAIAEWTFEQKAAAKAAKDKEESIKAEYKKSADSFRDKVLAYKEAVEDFDETIESVEDIPMPHAIQELVLSSENGPQLMYELAKNRAEYERICKLGPIAIAREVGKIEARLATSEKTKDEPKTQTKAPAPIKPVGKNASGGMKKSIYDTSLSQREFEKLREQESRNG